MVVQIERAISGLTAANSSESSGNRFRRILTLVTSNFALWVQDCVSSFIEQTVLI